MSSFDFAEAYSVNRDALQGDVLPEGDYTVVVKTAKATTTNSGKPAFRVQLEVVNGPNAGRMVGDQLTWSPESEVAMRIFSQSMEVLGAGREWIATTRPSADQMADRIVGATVEIFAKISEWNGQQRNNVSYRRRVSGAANGVVQLPDHTAPAPAAVASAWPGN